MSCVGGDTRVTNPVERQVGAHLGIEGAPVLDSQAGRLLDDQRRLPLRQCPAAPGTQPAGIRKPAPRQTRVRRRAPENPAAPAPPHWPGRDTASTEARQRQLRQRGDVRSRPSDGPDQRQQPTTRSRRLISSISPASSASVSSNIHSILDRLTDIDSVQPLRVRMVLPVRRWW